MKISTLPSLPELTIGATDELIINHAGVTYRAPISKLVTGGGSGGGFTNGETAPGSPALGDRWYVPSTAKLYTRINDGTSDQWVEL